ncbi:hypothetical protein HYZ70_01580 [Candidatus Curtissbacteria bacterium]|nr:hypothetical protein [Candidatus Curtissbacteria bacterium]
MGRRAIAPPELRLEPSMNNSEKAKGKIRWGGKSRQLEIRDGAQAPTRNGWCLNS